MILSFSVVMYLQSLRLTSNCLARTISSSFFLPTVHEALLVLFFPFLAIYFIHLSLWLSPYQLLDSVSSYSQSSSAFNSLCLYRFSYFWSMHLCSLFLLSAFPSHRACNYVPVRDMMSWMTQYTVNAPTLCKLLSNCPKWALKTMRCIRYSV